MPSELRRHSRPARYDIQEMLKQGKADDEEEDDDEIVMAMVALVTVVAVCVMLVLCYYCICVQFCLHHPLPGHSRALQMQQQQQQQRDSNDDDNSKERHDSKKWALVKQPGNAYVVAFQV